jgi:soluble lytic murein transglycosylase-like protein
MSPKRSAGFLRVVAVATALAVAGSAAATRVTVRPGDTLTAVARRNHTTVAALMAANHLTDANHIEVGQVLTLPGAASKHRAGPARAAGFGPPPTAVLHSLPALLVNHPARLRLRPAFRYWATIYGVRADLVEALAWMESGWQAKVVSPTGAVGIGQLEPATVVFVSGLIGVPLDPRVADQNIRMTTRYLRWLLDRSHSVAEALGGYYEGLASVQNKGPLLETVAYANGILAMQPGFSPG